MIKIINQKELMEVLSKDILRPLYINDATEQAVIEALSDNISIFELNYGSEGSGGFVGVITNDISSGVGEKEYNEVLSRYHIEANEWEFEEVLGANGDCEIRMQLFVLTEFNILLIFKKVVEK